MGRIHLLSYGLCKYVMLALYVCTFTDFNIQATDNEGGNIMYLRGIKTIVSHVTSDFTCR